MNEYSSYKDSGVEWIGEIPNGWNSVKIKSCFRERKDYGSDTEYQPLSVSKKGIVPQLENVSKTDNHNNRKIVQKGDFVINSRSDRKGSSGVSNLNGSVSVINIVLKPNSKVFNGLPNYLFKTYEFKEEFFRNGKGIHWDLWSTRFSEMKEMIIPLPPLNEQQEIVSYLDNKTSSIDSLIQSKEKKIELLKEKRTSLINQVVTKGLNPDVEMKDSGVEWIGSIPSHWTNSKFKYSSTLYTGNSLNEEQKLRYESDDPNHIPYISSKDIDVMYKTIDYHNGLRIPSENNPFRIGPKGSFVMVVEGGSSGKKMGVLEQDVCFVNKLCCFVSNHNSKFQYYFVQSSNFQDKFLLSMTGLIGGVSISSLRDFEIPLPPLNEQQEIVSYLDKETKLIDETISSEQKKIELLKEYKQSLISEVVTGKRKVTTDE